MSFWYLATPYSKFPGGIEAAFREACRQTGLLIKAGIPVFSPIAHTHPVAIVSGLDPLDHSISIPADKPLMEAAKGLIICELEGWETSKGIGEEFDFFLESNKQIVHMTPGDVPGVLAEIKSIEKTP